MCSNRRPLYTFIAIILLLAAAFAVMAQRPLAWFVTREPMQQLQYALSVNGNLVSSTSPVSILASRVAFLRKVLHLGEFAPDADVEGLLVRLCGLNKLLVGQMGARGLTVRWIDTLSLERLGNGNYSARLLLHFQPLYQPDEQAYRADACEDIAYVYTMTFRERSNRTRHESRYVIESAR